MQRKTNALSPSCLHVFQKSACMVDGFPEESLAGPLVVGRGKETFMVSTGTETGWDRGHRTSPPIRLL
jgi:hypothetical protein